MNDSNITLRNGSDMYYPLSFRIAGTLICAPLTIIGLTGNMMVILVILRIKEMRSSTNCYLLSLGIADILLFLSAMPIELTAYHVPWSVYLYGPVCCALFSFLPYLAINASSLSITAFTVERYIAICHPMRAKYVCTIKRARHIICGVWIFSIIYNSPWLFLTTIKPLKTIADWPDAQFCTFRLSRDQYKVIYMTDITFFYVIPLGLYFILYGKIASKLYGKDLPFLPRWRRPTLTSFKNIPLLRKSVNNNTDNNNNNDDKNNINSENPSTSDANMQRRTSIPSKYSEVLSKSEERAHLTSALSSAQSSQISKSRTQVIKMLLVIVLVFAVCWLPYRAVVVYNSFHKPTWINIWYLLFAKSCIFINSAINPILYNIMSAKFRLAFKELLLHCGTQKRVPLSHVHLARMQTQSNMSRSKALAKRQMTTIGISSTKPTNTSGRRQARSARNPDSELSPFNASSNGPGPTGSVSVGHLKVPPPTYKSSLPLNSISPINSIVENSKPLTNAIGKSTLDHLNINIDCKSINSDAKLNEVTHLINDDNMIIEDDIDNNNPSRYNNMVNCVDTKTNKINENRDETNNSRNKNSYSSNKIAINRIFNSSVNSYRTSKSVSDNFIIDDNRNNQITKVGNMAKNEYDNDKPAKLVPKHRDMSCPDMIQPATAPMVESDLETLARSHSRKKFDMAIIADIKDSFEKTNKTIKSNSRRNLETSYYDNVDGIVGAKNEDLDQTSMNSYTVIDLSNSSVYKVASNHHSMPLIHNQTYGFQGATSQCYNTCNDDLAGICPVTEEFVKKTRKHIPNESINGTMASGNKVTSSDNKEKIKARHQEPYSSISSRRRNRSIVEYI